MKSEDAVRFTVEGVSNPHGWWLLDYGSRREYFHTKAAAEQQKKRFDEKPPAIYFDDGSKP